MLAYDESERSFAVRLCEADTVKLVKRLNLRFEAPEKEQEEEFKARVVKASEGRQAAEAWLRYHHYIETMSQSAIHMAFDHQAILDKISEPFCRLPKARRAARVQAYPPAPSVSHPPRKFPNNSRVRFLFGRVRFLFGRVRFLFGRVDCFLGPSICNR